MQILTAALLSASLFAEVSVDKKEMVYKTTPQGDLKIHMYYPKDWKPSDKRPAIVLFFGGGFTGGDPKQFFSKAEYLAERGMVAASAEYRIKTKHNSNPTQSVEDCKSAIRWMRIKSKELGIDPKRLAAGGGSAGASCAAIATLTDSFEAGAENRSVSSKANALVLYNPAMEFSQSRNSFQMTDAEKTAWTKASPVHHAGPKIPPTIQFFGTDDALLTGARQFHKTAKAAGAKVELWTAAGQKHGFFNDRRAINNGATGWHEATLAKTDEFLTALGYLKGKVLIDVPAANKLVAE